MRGTEGPEPTPNSSFLADVIKQVIFKKWSKSPFNLFHNGYLMMFAEIPAYVVGDLVPFTSLSSCLKNRSFLTSSDLGFLRMDRFFSFNSKTPGVLFTNSE